MDDETQQLRYACLELACRQTIPTESDKPRDLSKEEAVAMAEEFYKFVTKKDLH